MTSIQKKIEESLSRLEVQGKIRAKISIEIALKGDEPPDTFEHEGMVIHDPWMTSCGRFECSPYLEYGRPYIEWLLKNVYRGDIPIESLRPLKFIFGNDIYEEPIDGFTDDTRWNGFINIMVTPETHKKLNDLYGEDLMFNAEKNGLIDYGGGAFITHEHDGSDPEATS